MIGWPLYPGSSEYDQIRYVVRTQGMPPADMLNRAEKTRRFFKQETFLQQKRWRIKYPDEYEREFGTKSKETRKFAFACLDDIAQAQPSVDYLAVRITAFP